MVSSRSIDSTNEECLNNFIEDIGEGRIILDPHCSFENAYLLTFGALTSLEQGRGTVLWLDGKNQFNPYTLSRYAKKFGIEAETALGNVYISRAFTYYQMVSLILERMGEAIEKFNPNLVVITGLLSLIDRSNIRKDGKVEFLEPVIEELRLFRRREESLFITDSSVFVENEIFSKLQSISDVILRDKNSDHRFSNLESRGNATLDDFVRDD